MTPSPESPQARLVLSRKALVRQMVQGGSSFDNDSPGSLNGATDAAMADAGRNSQHSSTRHIFTQAMMAWWQHHPVQVAVDIGRPFLNNYARHKPLQLICIAAGAGAAAVLIKPWRLVSVTGLAVAALRSTKLSSTLLSLLPRAAPQQYSKQTQQPANGRS